MVEPLGSWQCPGPLTCSTPDDIPIDMHFLTESAGYEKTVLSDLQGAWVVLRQSVVDSAGFEGWARAIFHIDEAMSWETVRHLERMPPLLLIIRNLCLSGGAPRDVIESIEDIEEVLVEVQVAIRRGEQI